MIHCGTARLILLLSCIALSGVGLLEVYNLP
ncbi:hypothetical protein BH18VER1_BH18VER1_11670 [soil metagenome]